MCVGGDGGAHKAPPRVEPGRVAGRGRYAVGMPLRASYDAEALAAFRQRWNVTQVEVFGSAIRDDFDAERSDVDLVLTFADEREIGLFDLAAMRRQLQTIFDRPVDLITRGSLAFMENRLRQQSILTSLERLDAA